MHNFRFGQSPETTDDVDVDFNDANADDFNESEGGDGPTTTTRWKQLERKKSREKKLFTTTRFGKNECKRRLCDQIWLFVKGLGDSFSYKTTLGQLLEKITSLNWNIWPHCSRPTNATIIVVIFCIKWVARGKSLNYVLLRVRYLCFKCQSK